MRLYIKMRPAAGKLILPVYYQEILQGFIYHTLQNKQFASFLHNKGYQYGKRSYKLFSFSRLDGILKFNRESKTISFENEVILQVSSILDRFIKDLGQSLLTLPSMHLNGQQVIIEEVRCSKPPVLASQHIVRTLSPITIYSTYEKQDGRKITQFFSPYDIAFSHLIEENLKKKYEAFYGTKADGEFHIRPVKVGRKDKVVTRFKDFVINAWLGQYEISGSPELLQFAYEVSIGGRNSQGFGMIELV